MAFTFTIIKEEYVADSTLEKSNNIIHHINRLIKKKLYDHLNTHQNLKITKHNSTLITRENLLGRIEENFLTWLLSSTKTPKQTVLSGETLEVFHSYFLIKSRDSSRMTTAAITLTAITVEHCSWDPSTCNKSKHGIERRREREGYPSDMYVTATRNPNWQGLTVSSFVS